MVRKKYVDLVEREHHQSEEEGKVGEMRYVTKLRDSELSIRWIDRREEDLLNMIGKTMLSDLLYFLALTCNVKKWRTPGYMILRYGCVGSRNLERLW